MTVDVEDYFQVSAFEPVIRRDDWDRYPCRIERNVDRILEIFAFAGTRATFFILGWIAQRYPGVVRAIAAADHEVASHGYFHVRATQQSPKEFERDVVRAKRIIEDISGHGVLGFRAASFSIDESNPWALEILREAGYRYSSSTYPIRSDLYGMPRAPRFPFRPGGADGILEIPITTVSVLKQNLPIGGGGYFRLFPYSISRWALRYVNERERRSAVFYFHPWEIDPGQPRQAGISFKSRFRHYLNLHRTERRLSCLVRDFQWRRMDEVFLPPPMKLTKPPAQEPALTP